MDIVEDWIPSKSVALNYILGDPRKGAFPQGKITEIFGPKSSAKSLILYDAGAQCQKKGGIFILIDSESSFHKGFGVYLGLNYKKLTGEDTAKMNILTIENLLPKKHIQFKIKKKTLNYF